MKLVFFGSSNYVIPIIEVLRKNFDLKLVLTTENPKLASQGEALQGETLKNLKKLSVIKYCIENKIPYLSVSNLSGSTISHKLLAISPLVGVLADFGLIIPEKVLNLFPKGIINIHPSLLPKYRGPTPVQTAILNGDKFTGVSIMKLDKEIDHGPILAQEKEEILDTDTAESLYKKLFAMGAILLPRILNKYLDGDIKPPPQNDKNATFTKPLTRQSGYVDFADGVWQMADGKLERMIRAYFPWPGVFTKLKIKNKELRVKLLPENRLQVEGKKPVSYKDFLNGYPEAKEILQKINL